MPLCNIQILLMRLQNETLFLRLLLLIFGFAALLVLCAAHEALELPDVVSVLTPVTEAMGLTPMGAECNNFTHRVVQQINIGGVVNIGFNDKGVAAPTQRFFGDFLDQSMACGDDDLIDLVEQLRGEQADVVLECLKSVVPFFKDGVPEHLAQGYVFK